MPKQIDKANVFATGTWNGLTFDVADLDAMVTAFKASESAGRVPLKLGHTGRDARYDDSAPALGWVTKLWREGTRLFATFSDVSDDLAQQIREGRYRFVSVELLKDARDNVGKTWRWLLDAVAVLGASKPAVANLQPLAMRRVTHPSGIERFIFTNRMEAKSRMNEAMRYLDDEARAGTILPRVREQFAREYGENGTLAEAVAFARAARSAGASKFSAKATARVQPGNGVVIDRPDEALLQRVAEKYGDIDTSRFEFSRRTGHTGREQEPSTVLEERIKAVMREDSALADQWKNANDPGKRG